MPTVFLKSIQGECIPPYFAEERIRPVDSAVDELAPEDVESLIYSGGGVGEVPGEFGCGREVACLMGAEDLTCGRDEHIEGGYFELGLAS